MNTIKIITHKDRKNDKIQSLKSHNIQKCITWCINNKIPYNKNYPSNNIFLGERIRAKRWIAVGLGFVGVLVISKPGFDNLNIYYW